ncbi:MAG TPA: DUF2017 family protein [Candidatus Lumbricidophila sp.]|nr:DUF2017 family protein [Candidatus Lumbricidophila sp.]
MIIASRSSTAGVSLRFQAAEAALLSDLADQVDSMLLLGSPDDPALARLLPNAYPDDAEAQRDYARYTRSSLIESKRAAAQQVRDATAPVGERVSTRSDASAAVIPDGDADAADADVVVELDESDAWVWLTFLTDLRLILNERVGAIEESTPEQDQRDDYLSAAYDWAGYLQGSMLEVLDPTDK